MKLNNKQSITSLIMIIGILIFNSTDGLYSQTTNSANNYLGQTLPGDTPELFYGGDFFTDSSMTRRSFNIAFSPDGKEMFFSYVKVREPEVIYEIKTFKFEDNQWISPKTASFSGEYWDVDINFSPDGKYVFFASDRPQPNSGNGDIYYSVKTDGGWSDPIYAGTDVNTFEGEVYPSFSRKGNIFYRSNRSGGYSDSDIYRAEYSHGNFINAKNLGPNVNSPYGQSNAVIAPDESYILLCTNRPEINDNQQIFISFQIGNNEWTKAENIAPALNINGPMGAPTLTSDGKYMFFSSRVPKRGLYWVSTKFIEDLRKKLI